MSALILYWGNGLRAEFSSRVPWPSRVVEHAATEGDQVRLAITNDRFSMPRFRDEA